MSKFSNNFKAFSSKSLFYIKCGALIILAAFLLTAIYKAFSSSDETARKEIYEEAYDEGHRAGYDDGYDDVYMDGDYDDDRYARDSDYADGVDDALDELGDD